VKIYYELISAADIKLMAAVVDKQHMQEDYDNLWYAPALAYEFLLQRVMMEVRQPDRVTVVIDDMSGKTPKDNDYKDNLIAHHRSLLRRGSRLQTRLDFSPLHPKLNFRDSAIAHLNQVADVVSYNIYRQFLDHGEDWESKHTDSSGRQVLPTYDRFKMLAHKFRQGPGGRIQGFGVVKIPLRNRVEWKEQEM